VSRPEGKRRLLPYIADTVSDLLHCSAVHTEELPMSLPRRSVLRHAALALALALSAALPAQAQSAGPQSLTLGMALEPAPGLDPTRGAASAIAEVTLYNIYETLTKFSASSQAEPLLAESWQVGPDQKSYTFKLRQGVRFHNGAVFDAAAVKYSFERAVAADSLNKDKAVFANIERIDSPDPYTVVLQLKQPNPDLPLLLAQGTAIIVEPGSAAGNASQPIGTGPYQFGSWTKGASLTLNKWSGYRNAASVAIQRVTFRFISDQAAMVAALLAGDVDAAPRAILGQSLAPFQHNPRFQILIGNSRGKTVLAINQKKTPLNDVRVRRAIAAAIDRQTVIDGAVEGLGTPIGAHYPAGAPGYLDVTGLNPHDVAKAQDLLKQAGVQLPLKLSLKLPPPAYARQGGEIIAAQLAQVGIQAQIENIEWAQWLDGVYKNKNYELTLISHVEPFDLAKVAEPGYYFGYESTQFRALIGRLNAATNEDQRMQLYAEAQRLLAQDAVNANLYTPRWASVANARLQGLWNNHPIFVNDLAALSWK
jgi:peptide/nickel transport system substrate-binding protein